MKDSYGTKLKTGDTITHPMLNKALKVSVSNGRVLIKGFKGKVWLTQEQMDKLLWRKA